jgi:dihydropteroate synthase
MTNRRIFRLRLPSQVLTLGKRTLIMGVLNVTPDSFSDGGKFLSVPKAVQRALEIQSAGADILDIGGESTRPGAADVPAAEELRRVLPILEALRGRLRIPVSIDTRKSAVAEIAVGAGAQIINDVSGLTHDSKIAQVAARHRVPIILMHMRGEPRTMQKMPFARNVMSDVIKGLHQSIAVARNAGIAKSQIVVDPGIGFGKSLEQNYELLRKLPQIASLGFPLLVGTSRKGFLGAALAEKGKSAPSDARLFATAASVAASILGGAHIVRVHDVAEMRQVAKVTDYILNS